MPLCDPNARAKPILQRDYRESLPREDPETGVLKKSMLWSQTGLISSRYKNNLAAQACLNQVNSVFVFVNTMYGE